MSLKKVIIAPDDPYDKSTWYEADVENVLEYLHQEFKPYFPVDAKIYHMYMVDACDVTPKLPGDELKLNHLEGVIYVIVKPKWVQVLWYIYYAVMAVAVAYSVYMIATMPKPSNNGSIGSSNNELQGRSNQIRLKSRIPDIFGQIRAYPDLIAVVYTYYVNGIEIEECLYVLGRGYYQIHDFRDGDTAVEGIDGVSVSAYDPGINIRGSNTIYRVGEAFTTLPLAVRKSDAINGQSAEKPNDVQLTSQSLYFSTGGVIRSSNQEDFTKYFKVGDGLAINGADYGIQDAILSGSAIITAEFKVIVTSNLNVESFDSYRGLLLSGATFEYIVEETTIDPETGESNTIIVERSFRDVSGQYDVSSVTQTSDGSIYSYTIQLQSPRQVNYNWNYVVADHTISAGITLNKNDSTIDLDGNYSVGAISSQQITLSNAATVNPDWDKLNNIGGSTQGQFADVDLEVVSNKWIGWFSIYFKDATDLHFNLYAPNGMYATTDSGKERDAGCTITIQYQNIDDDGNPVGEIQSRDVSIWAKTKDSFGRSVKYKLPTKGNVRFRLAKTYAKENNRPVTEVKVKDVYLSYALNKSSYKDVTVIRSKTIATDGAMSLKERKLNCLVTRKLKENGTGALVATRDAGQALINLALDIYSGRQMVGIDDIDVKQITAEIEAIKSYFGSEIATYFDYTFDDDNLTLEESVGMIASACFSQATRFGTKLRLKFDKPQDYSLLLFNHRNKVPGTEKRTDRFGMNKDHDGVELEYTSPDDDTRVTYKIPEDGTAINPLKIVTSGIRTHAVAKTRAWREYNKLLYKNVSVEFEALDESELLIRDDRILVADNTDVETQDGEIEAVNGLVLTTSQESFFDSSYQYYIYLQMPDGTVDMIQCSAGIDEYSIVLSRPPLQKLVVEDGMYIKTSYLLVKADDGDKQAFTLDELEPQSQMTNKVTASNYDSRVYERDHDFI